LRRQIFLDVFKGMTLRCEVGAPFAWLALPPHWSPSNFALMLQQRGVAVSPGSIFALGARAPDRFVRVCFGKPRTAQDLRSALLKLRGLTTEVPQETYLPVA
jgi:aspartate/methionine/tyrosine aminotransferase